MAKTVSIVSNEEPQKEKIRLYNGDLILVKMEPRNKKLDREKEFTFLVASYTSLDKNENLSKYCVFINLHNGAKAFAEPSSRQTTSERILNHLKNLRPTIYDSHAYKDPTFRIIRSDDYSLDIRLA